MTYLAFDAPAGTFSTTQGYTFPAGINANSGPLGTKLSLVLSNIIAIITLIGGLAFIYYFILGAINWISSAGDTQKAVLARQQILYSLIGLIIVILANPTLALLGRLLGVPLTDPETLINQFL